MARNGRLPEHFSLRMDIPPPPTASSRRLVDPRLIDPTNDSPTYDTNSEYDDLDTVNQDPTLVSEGNLSSRRTSLVEEDVCFPAPATKQISGIDYDELESYVVDEARLIRGLTVARQFVGDDRERHIGMAASVPRKRTGSMTGSPPTRKQSFYGDKLDAFRYPGKESDVLRFTFYSTQQPSTIHARSLCEIPNKGESLSNLMRAGCFWLDVLSPTDSEMKALSKIFRIHPLTTEDITMEEAREKCEVFKNYYFVCFRSFDQDHTSASYMQPLSVYIVVFKDGVLSFHFRPTPHPANVRKRIKQLKDYISVTPDWISYGLLDDITDSFALPIRNIEFEVDSIDELVLILKESEQSDMLRRIGHCRKKVMGLLRLLGNKADVIKTLVKRCETRIGEDGRGLSNEVALYLGDVQDHIITMLQSLNHYEKISSRSHSNYLAQISIEMTQTNTGINDVLTKLTALGSVLVPMNLVTGLWGMNVQVPGQDIDDLNWFFGITAGILTFVIICTIIMKVYHIV